MTRIVSKDTVVADFNRPKFISKDAVIEILMGFCWEPAYSLTMKFMDSIERLPTMGPVYEQTAPKSLILELEEWIKEHNKDSECLLDQGYLLACKSVETIISKYKPKD